MKIKIIILILILIFADSQNYEPVASAESGKSINKSNYADSVKTEFLHAWNGYKKYAWGHDALKPLTKTYHDWYGVSLLMTPVDAFDTMLLMGLKKEAEEAKKLIFEKLNFDKNIEVQHFEIVIRLLGGLLSNYQWDGDERFLELAKDLAERLYPVFNSPTGMPYTFVNLQTGKTRGVINNPAEIGTCLLEYGLLSRLTGNEKYYNAAKKAMLALIERSSPFGLVGTTINVETGKWLNTDSHLSGMIDSYYEYLLKAEIVFGRGELNSGWEKAIGGINNFMADTSFGGLWYSHVNMNTGERLRTQFGALDAFFPAALALSGDIKRAEALHENCFKMWSEFGIEPEQYDYSADSIISAAYFLRPENIESDYYLYHFTENQKYLKRGVVYFESLKKYCRTDAAYCRLKSVITMEKSDAMESFFLAETMKYLYLIFAGESVLNFDDVIFNTEAHPFKRKLFIK